MKCDRKETHRERQRKKESDRKKENERERKRDRERERQTERWEDMQQKAKAVRLQPTWYKHLSGELPGRAAHLVLEALWRGDVQEDDRVVVHSWNQEVPAHLLLTREVLWIVG